MTDQQYFDSTSLSFQLKAAKQELAAFRSGDVYVKMRADYESIIRQQAQTIARLRREIGEISFSRKQITRNWQEVIDEIYKEHEKSQKKLEATIRGLEAVIARQNEMIHAADEKYRKRNQDYYDTASQLEETAERNRKLTAQAKRSYENASLPSSKCIDRKKIANSREKTGKKPGAQMGHPHHPRKKLEPTDIEWIPPSAEYLDGSKHTPTGRTVKKQVVKAVVTARVIEYRTLEYRCKESGRLVHAPFPAGVRDDVNYDDTVKALAFLLNSRCNVSIEKTGEFLSDLTRGQIRPSNGMISGLCREFSGKSKDVQDGIYKLLLDAPVMNTDGTVVKVNGVTNYVFVNCADGKTLYCARKSKGHKGVEGTPVEQYGGILVHDHDVTYYRHGSGHQECMVHILRYLKDSMENETSLTWSGDMRKLVQEMIHATNGSEGKGLAGDVVDDFERRYDSILQTAAKEYEYEPPGKYYPNGYNLYERMVKYKEKHLLFLHNPHVPPSNNLAERKARIIKGKVNQSISLRSFEHLSDYCDCLSVVDFLREKGGNLLEKVASIFQKPKLKTKSERIAQ